MPSLQDNNERSVAIAVRIHKTLELADDKYYMITCGRAGFQNLENKTSLVTLELLREGRKVEQVVYGREYMLRAHISQYDGSVGMRVRRCFSFSDLNTTVELVDHRGCPDRSIMSQFQYDSEAGTAEARLFSMFKFPESNRVHFQCDIVICKGEQWLERMTALTSALQETVRTPTAPVLPRICPRPRPGPSSPRLTPVFRARRMTGP